MKILLTIFLIGYSLAGISQIHQVGLSGGINTLVSWNGDPALGNGSPFDSKVGYSTNLSYSFIFENGLSVDLRNSLSTVRYQADDFFALIGENDEIVQANLKYFERYYHISMGGGYLFNLNERYSIQAQAGGSMMYFYKEIAYSEGYPETRVENSRDREDDHRYFGFYLAINNIYSVYKTRGFEIALLGSLSATQVFDYVWSGSGLNRVLPEVTLGVAVAFGKSGGSRF